MPNRFPLIVDSPAQQIREIPANDNLDLTSCGIVGVTSVGIGTTSLNNPLQVNSGSSSVIVNSTGNLGIRTTSSSNPLQVGSGSSAVIVDTLGDLGIGTLTAPTKIYVNGNAASNIVGLGSTSTATTLDFSQGNNFSFSLGANITLANPINLTVGQSGIILIQQDGVGSRTIGFGSHWDFPNSTAPTLSIGANALDCLTYFVRTPTSIVANSLIGIGTL